MVAQIRTAGPRKGSHVRHRARAYRVVAANGRIHQRGIAGAQPDPGGPGGQLQAVARRTVDGALVRRPQDAQAEYVYDRRFDGPDARATFLAPTPEGAPGASTASTPPAGLSSYMSSLYNHSVFLPREDEARLFLRMNYLKHLAGKLRAALDPETATGADREEIERVESEARAVRDTIVRANLRLVVSIAKTRTGPGRSFDELVSDGNLTLMNAVGKFDASRGFKFSTYAACSIIRNLARAAWAEGRQHSRFATGNDVLLEGATAPHGNVPVSEGEQSDFEESVRRVLDRLTDREREVIAARFGLGGEPEKTFHRVGEELGVTRERVRQIQTRALEKLRGYAEELGLDPRT